MQITLMIDGEQKSFVQNFVSGKYYRLGLEILKKIDKGELDEVEALNAQLELIVGIFGNQFTLEQLEDGIDAQKMEEICWNVIRRDILKFKPYDVAMKNLEKMQEDFLQKAQTGELAVVEGAQ